MSTIEKALRIALEAHEGVKRKNGEPYIMHPIRVAMQMDTEEEWIAAIIHDTVEDTKGARPPRREITLDLLRSEGFSEAVVVAVDCLSRREFPDGRKEKYLSEFIPRIMENGLARRVKKGDLQDNRARPMNIAGADSLDKKYARAQDMIDAYEKIQRTEKELKRMREAEGA